MTPEKRQKRPKSMLLASKSKLCQLKFKKAPTIYASSSVSFHGYHSNYLKFYLPLLDTMKLKELARICVAGLDSLSFEFNYGILLTTAEYIKIF